MQKRITAIVTGRVQLVMFRDFCQRKARSLGLVGSVQNLPDGSVSVTAEGETDALNQYISYLHKGSVLSRVDGVKVEWGEPDGTFSDFLILY
jgi:acylphosphatase